MRLLRPGRSCKGALLATAGAILLSSSDERVLHSTDTGDAMALTYPPMAQEHAVPSMLGRGRGIEPFFSSKSSTPRQFRTGSTPCRAQVQSTARPRARWARSTAGILLGLCIGLAAASSAKAAAVAARPHLGIRLATKMKTCFSMPDWAILMMISALPLVELRGGVPVGLWMGLAVPQVMIEQIKQLLSPLLKRAAQKTEPIGAHDRWVGVAAFVGVPLPGTGAWTGAMVAYLLGMDLWEARFGTALRWSVLLRRPLGGNHVGPGWSCGGCLHHGVPNPGRLVWLRFRRDAWNCCLGQQMAANAEVVTSMRLFGPAVLCIALHEGDLPLLKPDSDTPAHHDQNKLARRRLSCIARAHQQAKEDHATVVLSSQHATSPVPPSSVI
eukprot:s2315_g6.t1